MAVNLTINTLPSNIQGFTIDGAGEYEIGNQVTIRISGSSNNYRFSRWYSEGVIDSNDTTYSFTITNNLTVQAIFECKIETSVTPVNSGSVNGSGWYEYNTIANLTAIPSSAYDFNYWSENDVSVSDNTTYSFTVDTARSIVANFKPHVTKYTVSVSVDPQNAGTYTIEGSVSGFSPADNKFVEEELITITQYSNNNNYLFVGFYNENDALLTNEDEYKFYIYENTILTLKYLDKSTLGTVTYSSNDTTYGNVNVYLDNVNIPSGENILVGKTIQLVATPTDSNSYRFVNWDINGETITTNPYNYVVNDDTTIVGYFSINPEETTILNIPINASVDVGGSISIPINNYDATHTYEVSWKTDFSDEEHIASGSINSGNFVLPINQIFESLAPDRETYNIFLKANEYNQDNEEILYQPYDINRPIKIIINNDFNPSITFDNWVFDKQFQNNNISGLSTYSIVVNVGLSAPTGYTNSARLTSLNYTLLSDEPDNWSTHYTDYYVKDNDNYIPNTSSTWHTNTYYMGDVLTIRTNIGNFKYEQNNSNTYTITGTFEQNTSNYDFVLTCQLSDSRGKAVTEEPASTPIIIGYSYPQTHIVSLFKCNDAGIPSEVGNKIHVDFRVEYKEIYILLNSRPSNWLTNYTDYYVKEGDFYVPNTSSTWQIDTYYIGNRVLPSYCNIYLNDDETEYGVSVNPTDTSIFYQIIGRGELEQGVNRIEITYKDYIMNLLLPEEFSVQSWYSLNNKQPLSLLDDLNGNVGIALGKEGEELNNISLALNTTFDTNVTVSGSKYNGGNINTVSIDAYDLINNSTKSVQYNEFNKENITYMAQYIRCMPRADYELLPNKDNNTLYFLTDD